MDKLEYNAYWNIFKGKLIQRYALLVRDVAAYQYGKKNEFNGRFQQRIAKKRGIHKIAIKILVSGFFLLIVTAASAQDNEGSQSSISIGPQVGFFKSQYADNAQVMWGGAVRFKFSEVLGIEGSVNYREEEFNNGAVKVTSWPVMVTALLYPIPVIYGAIGAGWYNSSTNYNFPSGVNPANETKQEVGWHFGGGLELPVGPSVKLVGDVRYVFLNYDFQNFPGSNGTTSNFYVIDIGLLFRL